MSNRTTDRAIIAWAVGLLKAGILPSAIPGRLMEEFGVTPERARDLATEAIKRHKKRGRLDTKPLEDKSD